MKSIPLKRMKVWYIYGFRFLQMPSTLLDKLEGEEPHMANKGFAGFDALKRNSGEGFQPYLARESEVFRTSSSIGIPVSICDTKTSVTKDRKTGIHKMTARCDREISLCTNGLGTYTLALTFGESTDEQTNPNSEARWSVPSMTQAQCLEILNMGEEVLPPDWNVKRFKLSLLCKKGREISGLPLPAWAAWDLKLFYEWLYHRATKVTPGQKPAWVYAQMQSNNKMAPLLKIDTYRLPGGKICRFSHQTPYVYAELETSTYDEFMELSRRDHIDCMQDRKLDCLRGVLAHLLVRVGPTGLDTWKLDPTYLRHHSASSSELFRNYYPLRYLFVNTHFRSTLAVFPNLTDAKTVPVAVPIREYILPAIRDTLQILRARWYFLVTEHAYVDSLVHRLREAWATNPEPTQEFLEVQQHLLNARFHVAELMTHPIVYRRAASSLNDIYLYLNAVFGNDVMQDSLGEKLKQTLDIYEECLRIRLTEKYHGKQPRHLS